MALSLILKNNINSLVIWSKRIFTKKRDFNSEFNKDEMPAVILKMLGVEDLAQPLNSAGGTTVKNAWILVAERIEELKNEGKLII